MTDLNAQELSPASETISPSTQSMITVAVVGCGRWGKNLARNFHHLGALKAICDLEPETLKAQKKLFPEVNTTAEFHSLLVDPNLTAVVISTPSQTHFKLAKAAILAGKHVYVEKPIATTAVETKELFELATQHERILMVGHLLLYHPAVNRLKQLIDEGYLGEIRYIQSDRLNFNPYRQDKSVLWDLAPHDLAMVCYLLGQEPISVVSAHGHRTSADGLIDVAHIELAFAGGVGGHIHSSWIHPSKQVKLIVRGTERIAMMDDTLESGKLQIFSKDDDRQAIKEFPEYLAIEPLKLECQHFINAIRDNRPPKTDGPNGYTVVRVLEEAEKLLETIPLSEAISEYSG